MDPLPTFLLLLWIAMALLGWRKTFEVLTHLRRWEQNRRDVRWRILHERVGVNPSQTPKLNPTMTPEQAIIPALDRMFYETWIEPLEELCDRIEVAVTSPLPPATYTDDFGKPTSVPIHDPDTGEYLGTYELDQRIEKQQAYIERLEQRLKETTEAYQRHLIREAQHIPTRTLRR